MRRCACGFTMSCLTDASRMPRRGSVGRKLHARSEEPLEDRLAGKPEQMKKPGPKNANDMVQIVLPCIAAGSKLR